MLAAPTLAGSVLRRPNTYTPGRVPVREDVVLAGGALRRYTRGYRRTAAMTWENLTGADTATIEAAAREGALMFTDPHGVTWWAMVENGPDPVPVPGTDPERYAVSLSLVGRDVVR